MTTPLLQVNEMSVTFPVMSNGLLRKQIGDHEAVKRVSFSLSPGESLGIVGESGSGKTTLARAILRALSTTASSTTGSANFNSKQLGMVDLATLDQRSLMLLRTEMQMIFQDPFSSLNPRMKVSDIVAEPLEIHQPTESALHREKVIDILAKVGLEADCLHRFPHAFSGGQRQRIGIARALILNPSLVVCDEAVSALDMSVQAQILNLLQDLQKDMGLTYLFVAHDLNVVHHFCERTLVMYQGKVVESGPVKQIFANPVHDYTRLLLSAIPSIDPDQPLSLLSRDGLNFET